MAFRKRKIRGLLSDVLRVTAFPSGFLLSVSFGHSGFFEKGQPGSEILTNIFSPS